MFGCQRLDLGDIIRAVLRLVSLTFATLFYSKFSRVITQSPAAQQIIPLRLRMLARMKQPRILRLRARRETKFWPSLLPRIMSTQIFSALLENRASEQGARMSAMDNATRNAGEMIDKLTLEL